MKLLLSLAFALSLGVLLFSFSLPGRVAILGNDPGYFRALYARDHPQAQVVLIGSSRMRRAFDGPHVAAGLGLPPGSVVNLGHPGSMTLFDFEVLQEMLEKDRLAPEVIFIGALSTSWQHHIMEKATGGAAPLERVALSTGQAKLMGVSGSTPPSLAALARTGEQNAAMATWNLLTLHAQRLNTHIKLALGGRSTWEVFFPNPKAARPRANQAAQTSKVPMPKRPQWQAEQDAYKAAFDGAAPTGALDPQDYLSNPNFITAREGLRGVARLAAARGIKAYALYLPGVHTPQLPDAFRTKFEAEIGMPLLTFPPQLRAALGAQHYDDATHVTAQGRIMTSDWLVEQLIPELSAR